jgi:hypothetical protein
MKVLQSVSQKMDNSEDDKETMIKQFLSSNTAGTNSKLNYLHNEQYFGCSHQQPDIFSNYFNSDYYSQQLGSFRGLNLSFFYQNANLCQCQNTNTTIMPFFNNEKVVNLIPTLGKKLGDIADYCWWNQGVVHIINPTQNICTGSTQFNASALPSVIEPEVLPEGVNISSRLKMSKSDFNIQLLKEYAYTTEEKGVDENGKPQIIYICKFDNWNKEFTRTWNILDHARMHKGIKPYHWDYWGKKFTQRGNLKKHAKTHMIPNVDQRKRYRCEFCGSSYTERYNYRVWLVKVSWINFK